MESFTYTFPVLTPPQCVATFRGRILGWSDPQSEAEEHFWYFQGNIGTLGGWVWKPGKINLKKSGWRSIRSCPRYYLCLHWSINCINIWQIELVRLKFCTEESEWFSASLGEHKWAMQCCCTKGNNPPGKHQQQNKAKRNLSVLLLHQHQLGVSERPRCGVLGSTLMKAGDWLEDSEENCIIIRTLRTSLQ